MACVRPDVVPRAKACKMPEGTFCFGPWEVGEEADVVVIVAATPVQTDWVSGPRSEGLWPPSQGSPWSRSGPGKDVFSPSFLFWVAQVERSSHPDRLSQV